jgi:type VI protein secretion system component Hcp
MSIPGLTTTPVQITAVAWDGQTGAAFSGILVTKVPDTTSPLLFAAMTGGTALPSVQIIAGSATYDLAGVLLPEMSAQPDAKGHVSETVRLTCAKMTVTVAGTSRCFNFQTNTAC